MKLYHHIAAFLALWLVVTPVSALAESVNIGPFELYFAGTGEHPYSGVPLPPEYQETISTRPFKNGEKGQILQAMNYWAERASGQNNALRIYVGFSEDTSGSAFSLRPVDNVPGGTAEYGISPNGSIYDYFILGKASPLSSQGIADNAIIFQDNYTMNATRILLNDSSIVSTMLHEMGHAMGIWASTAVTNPRPDEYSYTGRFSVDTHTAWNSHLVDIFGVKAAPGMSIQMITSGDGDKKDGIFQLYGGMNTDLTEFKYPTFHGPQVDALTGGEGMPVMGGYPEQGDSVLDGANSLGHPGIMQSIMSYGLIRNMPFTEMEIAAFQDMGYDLDRRQFFGKSYYYDVGGNTQTNALGFGSAAAPNMSTFGLGLHVMRDNLTLTQSGDIYAAGYGGGGVRIDGVGNTVTIPGGVNVKADGDMGTGLLVSYGSNNKVQLGGTITAAGEGGIGAHFAIGSASPHIYSHTDYNPDADPGATMESKYEYGLVSQDFSGPLVTLFDIRGHLQGQLAAIQIGADAHVETITAHAGAVIDGNIISQWPRFLDSAEHVTTEHATTVIFGEMGEKGQVTVWGNMDGTPNIKFFEDFGNFSAAGNALDVRQNGAVLSYNGNATVYSWEIAQGATLKGNSTITLTGPDFFLNKGTIAPGNSIGSITIEGDFQNEGTLHMEFDGKGKTDTLSVTGKFAHNATTGKVVMSAFADYYSGGRILLDTSAMFSGGADSELPDDNDFADAIDLASPTLRMDMLRENNTHYAVVSRPAGAYSRHAASGNSARVGRVFDAIAEGATGDMRELIKALDFSAPDSSALHGAMKQLSAAPYAQATQASMEANLNLGRRALQQLRTVSAKRGVSQNATQNAPQNATRNAENAHKTIAATAAEGAGLNSGGGDNATQWSAFVMPFGGGSLQESYNDTPGYNSSQAGIMGGLSRQTGNITMSLYTAFSRRQVDMWTSAGAHARSDALHLGAAALWSEKQGRGWQFFAEAQLGLENTDMRRSVEFENFARQSAAFYTSWNGVGMLGGGYLWQIGELSLGPQVGLEYAFNFMPGVNEDSGGGARLSVESHTRQSMYAVGGLTVAWDKDLGEDRAVRASLDAAWRQDLMPQFTDTRAHFVGYQQGFDTRTERQGQGSLGLAGGLEVHVRRDLTLSATVQADVLRAGYTNVVGGLSVRWDF